ncbi:MAG: hypothetical protein ACM3PP_11930, partial [Candidatus Saccharibacteria bacterium]
HWTSKSYIDGFDCIELYNFMPAILRDVFVIGGPRLGISLDNFRFDSSWRMVVTDKGPLDMKPSTVYWNGLEVAEHRLFIHELGNIDVKFDVAASKTVYYETNELRLERICNESRSGWSVYNKSADIVPIRLMSGSQVVSESDLTPNETAALTLENFYLENEKGILSVDGFNIPIEAFSKAEVLSRHNDSSQLTVGHIKGLITGSKASITTFTYVLTADLETGMIELSDENQLIFRENWPDIGPPFKNGIIDPLKVSPKAELIRTDTGIRLVLQAENDGVLVTRTYDVDASHLINVSTTLNVTNDRDLINKEFIIYPWLEMKNVELLTPLKRGLLRGHVSNVFPLYSTRNEYYQNSDLPRDPGQYAKTWSCFCCDGRTAALLWDGADEILFGYKWMPRLLYKLTSGDEVHLPDYYYYYGPGDFQTIDRLWDGLFRKQQINLNELPYVHLDFPQGAICLSNNDGAVIEGSLATFSKKELKGDLHFAFPEEWGLAEQTVKVKTSLNQPCKIKIPVDLTGIKPGCYTIQTVLTSKAITANLDFQLVILADLGKRLIMSVEKKSDFEVISVDNGLVKLEVAPAFDGSMIGLYINDKKQLRSSFPAPRAMSLCLEWYGGIKPCLLGNRDILKNSFSQEKLGCDFSYSLIEYSGTNGTEWYGVGLHTNDLPGCNGVNYSVEYLTTAGSNLLCVRQVLINSTDFEMSVPTMIKAFLSPNGSGSKYEFYYSCNGNLYHHEDDKEGGAFEAGAWAAIGKKGGPYWVVMENEGPPGCVLGVKWHEQGLHLADWRPINLEPGQKTVTSCIFAYTEDFKMAQQYQRLQNFKLFKNNDGEGV